MIEGFLDYFYIGDYTCGILILMCQTFYTYEMKFVKTCLSSTNVETYLSDMSKAKRERIFTVGFLSISTLVLEAFYYRMYVKGIEELDD